MGGRLAGIRVPIEAAKGYHVQLRNGGPTLRSPLIFQESVFAATPLDIGLRLAGTMEFVGMNQQLAQQRALRLLKDARAYLAGLDAPAQTATWCGLRPFTPDNLPIVGISTRAPNLLLAAGTQCSGSRSLQSRHGPSPTSSSTARLSSLSSRSHLPGTAHSGYTSW